MPHQFLTYDLKNNEELLRILTIEILNYYSNKNIHSKKRWLKLRSFTFSYTTPGNGQKEISLPISYEIVYKELKEHSYFDTFKFNLPPMMCHWLDYSLKYNLNFHPQPGLDFFQIDLKSIYGATNPVSVTITEPTIFVTSMMATLFRHIIFKRNELVHRSSELFKLEWLIDFRNLISDTISLADITFNRLHYKAEFDKPAAWKFDKNDIGERFGRRIMDKISWVFKITGNNLPDISIEKAALNNLKELRNLLMHFDPAHFEIKLKDLPKYLNDIVEIGHFIFKIRKTIEAEISSELIFYLLQPNVVYHENKTFELTIQA